MTRFLWRLLEWPLALALAATTHLVLATSRLSTDEHAATGPAIYVIWHRHLPLVMPVCGRARRWIMMSGSPYMAPIARWASLLGLRLVRGATAERGRAALDELAEKLRAGDSVLLAVDGPSGPPFVVKPGCVDLALATGAPIVALASRGRGTFVTPGRWDRQLVARPFAQLQVVASAPIDPRGATRDALLLRVQTTLEALERP